VHGHVSRTECRAKSQYRIDNSTFERVELFKYLGTSIIYQNSIQDDIKQIEVMECLLSFGAESFVCSLLSKNIKSKIYRTIILPVVLCGYETWLLTLGEELRLRVFECGMLRRVLGPKRDEVTGEWRRLRDEELNDLYFSLNIIRVIKSRRIRWAGHIACMGERGGIYTVLVGGGPEGKISLGRPRHRWEGNIKMDLQELGWGT